MRYRAGTLLVATVFATAGCGLLGRFWGSDEAAREPEPPQVSVPAGIEYECRKELAELMPAPRAPQPPVDDATNTGPYLAVQRAMQTNDYALERRAFLRACFEAKLQRDKAGRE